MLEVTGLTSVLHISSVDEVVEMFCTPSRVIEYLDHAGLSSSFGGPVLITNSFFNMARNNLKTSTCKILYPLLTRSIQSHVDDLTWCQ